MSRKAPQITCSEQERKVLERLAASRTESRQMVERARIIDTWLAEHPNVHFHYTPTSASWLNLVEVWFGIMSRIALRGASFNSVEELRQAIESFIAVYNPTAKPFKWRKREVKGTQLRDTIVNLCRQALARIAHYIWDLLGRLNLSEVCQRPQGRFCNRLRYDVVIG